MTRPMATAINIGSTRTPNCCAIPIAMGHMIADVAALFMKSESVIVTVPICLASHACP